MDLSDEDLVDAIKFAHAVMHTDSEIDDVWLEYEDGSVVTYPELLAEAARRA